MPSRAIAAMAADEELRALLTEREREILSGDADVSESYYYRVVSRVRTKIERLEEDRELLDAAHDGLSEELRDAVCTDFDEETD